MSYSVQYKDRLLEISEMQLPPAGATRYCDVTGLLCTVQFQAGRNSIFISDFSTNPILHSYNPISESPLEFKGDQILRVIAYEDKLTPFLQKLQTRHHFTPSRDSFYKADYTSQAIFVRVKLRYKNYMDTLSTTAHFITLLDQESFDPTLPVFKNLPKYLPRQYLKDHRASFLATIPQSYLDHWINPERYPSPLPGRQLTASTHESSATYVFQRPLSEEEEDANPVVPLQVLPQTDTQPSPNAPHQQQQLLSSPTQLPPQLHSIAQQDFRKMNQIEHVDGKIYKVLGTILEIEPLERQFCIKTSIKEPPQLMPLTITLQGNESDSMEKNDLEESNLLRVSFIEKSHILKFLGLNEVEEAYLVTDEIEAYFEKLVQNGNQVAIPVKRRTIVINDSGYSILGWESTDLTLSKLLNEEIHYKRLS